MHYHEKRSIIIKMTVSHPTTNERTSGVFLGYNYIRMGNLKYFFIVRFIDTLQAYLVYLFKRFPYTRKVQKEANREEEDGTRPSIIHDYGTRHLLRMPGYHRGAPDQKMTSGIHRCTHTPICTVKARKEKRWYRRVHRWIVVAILLFDSEGNKYRRAPRGQINSNGRESWGRWARDTHNRDGYIR